MYGQLNRPMMTATIMRPGLISPPRQPSLLAPHADANPRAKSKIGSDRTTSVMREMNVSTLPRKNPEMMPRTTPITKARPVAASAMNSEVRAP